MQYYGIMFKGIVRSNINCFIKEILGIKQINVSNSNFHTDDLGDFEYSDQIDLSEICNGSFVAVMNVSELLFHRPYQNVLCLILNDDNDLLTVECSIADMDFPEIEISDLKKWCIRLCDEKYISNADIFDDYD